MTMVDEESNSGVGNVDMCPSSHRPYRRHPHQHQQQHHMMNSSNNNAPSNANANQRQKQMRVNRHSHKDVAHAHAHAHGHGHYWNKNKGVRVLIAASVCLYIVLMIGGFHLLEKRRTSETIQIMDSRQIKDTISRHFSYDQFKHTSHHDYDTHHHVQRALKMANERAHQRRLRTSVNAKSAPSSQHTKPYTFHYSNDRTHHETESPPMEPPDQDALCGAHAQAAAKHHPHSYQTRDALTDQSTVLITGILSPLGFHLALKLQQQCNVNAIIGIDHMYPNTALHRLHLMNRIAILSKQIPKLIKQPLILPFTALDPRQNSKKKKTEATVQPLLNPTGEINLIQQYKPTHIVHLASYQQHSFRDTAALHQQWHNTDSPYTTDTRNPPFFEIRQSTASMEHILASIAAGNNHTDPHFLYATSSHIHDLPFLKNDILFETSNTQKQSSQQQQQQQQQQEWGKHTNNQLLSNTHKISNEPQHLHSNLKLIDETLARSYHAVHNISSIGLRFHNVIYGPWGNSQDDLYKLADAAAATWNTPHKNTLDTTNSEEQIKNTHRHSLLQAALLDDVDAHSIQNNYLYVQDAVDSIIAAMQYRHTKDSPAIFDIASSPHKDSTATLSNAAAIMEDYMTKTDDNDSAEPNKWNNRHNKMIDVGEDEDEKQDDDLEDESILQTKDEAHLLSSSTSMIIGPKKTLQYLNWKPTTSLKNGVMKLLAWHLDQTLPYGPPPPQQQQDGEVEEENKEKQSNTVKMETGNDFLKRQNAPICSPDDTLCHEGSHVFPCASECTTSSSTCKPSIFDNVIDLVIDVTEGCDVILLSQLLGHDVKDISLPAEFVEETHDELLHCNVVLVPKESELVKMVISKVPSAAIQQFGITEDTPEEKTHKKHIVTDEKLDKLNGRLVHKGWIVVWIDNAMTPLSHEDKNLLKLSPGRFLHPSVKYLMYVEEGFPSTPNSEDILFLVDQMKRKKKPEMQKKYQDSNSIYHTYHLPAEPARRAAILVGPMKMKLSDDDENDDDNKHDGSSSSQRLTLYEATKYMRFEMGDDPNMKEKGPSPTRQQRMFYERVISTVNKADARSTFEPSHRFDFKNYIRSRWLVYDMKVELARRLRCEWYQEHSKWESDLDQLSFAYVMASRELTRKYVHDEPDDHVLAAMPSHAEIEKLSDAHEWHALLDEDESLEYEHAHYRVKKVPLVGGDGEGNDDGDEAEANQDLDDVSSSLHGDANEAGLYLRIMSDEVMNEERRQWQYKRQMKHRKKKHKK